MGEDRVDGSCASSTLHLFGGPFITVDGRRREVPEGSKRLLAFVGLRGHRVERRLVAGALWPIGDDSRAAGNLRSALWRLRGAGIDVLAADKWSLELRDGVAVDVHAVAGWATRLIENRAEPGDLMVPVLSMEALDLLPGCYDDWALMERERLRQRMLHALEVLSSLLTGVGRFADAVEAAMRSVSAEPLRESAQRALIEAQLAEGNVVEARRAYRAFESLLRRELGVAPSPPLAQLVAVADHVNNRNSATRRYHPSGARANCLRPPADQVDAAADRRLSEALPGSGHSPRVLIAAPQRR